jgi:hypothetical protein
MDRAEACESSRKGRRRDRSSERGLDWDIGEGAMFLSVAFVEPRGTSAVGRRAIA